MSCNKHYNWTTDTPCPYCRIVELEQQLAEAKDTQTCVACDDFQGWKERSEKAEQQLSRYQGGVEVEAVATLSDSQTRAEVWLDELPYEFVGKRVRVLVMEVE